MIHVNAQPEPAAFDADVRQKGIAFLKRKNIVFNQPVPVKIKIEPYWRACLDDLYSSYHGKCAYLAVFFERVTGGGSVDHFIAKSKRSDLSYEWSNYRLACSKMNSQKHEYDDVLDPFEIKDGWFHLEIVSGRIYPNPNLDICQNNLVQATIDRLGLDDERNREMRARHYQEYRERLYTDVFLQRRSPFVYAEAARQGLL
ncbi:MAG: hypothetical protein HQK77_11190 [Desulfobacterales bacterium]|nr:hypothetical protein [Desulfobacterales bacterium]